MGSWRQEYERDWRGFTTRALADSFGDQYNAQAATDADRSYLAQLLKSMGVRDHAVPTVPTYVRASTRPRPTTHNSTAATASYQETQLLDDLVSDDEGFGGESFRAAFNTSSMSNVSYVYKTPQKRTFVCVRVALSSRVAWQMKHGRCNLTASVLTCVHDVFVVYLVERRASSGHFFPQFSTQDFLPEGDHARRESASQTLRIRMADMSPIASVGHNTVHRTQQEERTSITRDGGAHQERTDDSPASPSVSESPDAALLRSGDEEFLTPRPNANRHRRQHTGADSAAHERQASALHELSVHDSRRVYDLDVSMQSMNLSDDGFMIVDNPDDEKEAHNPDAGSDRSRTRLDADDEEDAVALGARNKVLKVLCFSSESEDEEMNYEYGGGSAYDEPDEEMDQADGDDEDGDCVVSAKQHQVVKVEPDSEDVEILEVMAPVEKRPVMRPHVVNASRESCDSVDSHQGTR